MGKVAFRWEPGFDPGYILRQINEIRKVENGKSSFSAFEYEYWVPVLNSAVVTTGRAKPFKSRVITKALADGTFDLAGPPDNFLALCDLKLTEIAAAELNEYIVFCRVTHVGPRLIDELYDGDTRILWDPPKNNRLYKAVMAARISDVLEHAKESCGVTDDADGLTPILVFVRANNPKIAYEIATDAVDTIRGIINLLINAQRSINPMPGLSNAPPHAINRIRRAPYETVHKPDGSFAVEMFWYEARWSHSSKPIKFSDPVRSHRKTIKRWWRDTKKSPLTDLLTEGYIRYCRALDNHDRDVSLMELWGALEALLGTYKNDQIVSRIVRLFDDEASARQLAEHIRVRRNATVHSATGPDHLEAETIVVQAQRLVARALTFLTNDAISFKSAREFQQFLDLPLNAAELERQRKLIGEFLDYRQNKGRWRGASVTKDAPKRRSPIIITGRG